MVVLLCPVLVSALVLLVFRFLGEVSVGLGLDFGKEGGGRGGEERWHGRGESERGRKGGGGV